MMVTMGGLMAQQEKCVNQNSKIKQKFLEAQTAEIIKQLELTGQEAEMFREAYTKYSQEMATSLTKRFKISRENLEKVSEQEAETQMLANFQNNMKTAQIQEKYFREFRKIMSAKEVMEMYIIEKEVRRKVSQEMRERRQLKKQGNGREIGTTPPGQGKGPGRR